MPRIIFFLSLAFMSSFIISSPSNAQSPHIIFTFGDWKPIIYRTEDGQPQGLYFDLLTEIFTKEMGMTVEFRQRPWKRAQLEVENGEADFMITIPTDARAQYTVKTERPIFDLYMGVYTYADHPKLEMIEQIKTVEDIAALDLLAVTNLGNGWHAANIEEKGVRTFQAPEDINIAKVLAAKRADIMIDAIISMNQIIREERLSDRIELTDATFGPLSFFLLMSKKSQYLTRLPEFNQVFAKLTANGTVERIINSYIEP